MMSCNTTSMLLVGSSALSPCALKPKKFKIKLTSAANTMLPAVTIMTSSTNAVSRLTKPACWTRRSAAACYSPEDCSWSLRVHRGQSQVTSWQAVLNGDGKGRAPGAPNAYLPGGPLTDDVHYLLCHSNTLLCDQITHFRFLRQYSNHLVKCLIRAIERRLASQGAAALFRPPACVNPGLDYAPHRGRPVCYSGVGPGASGGCS